MNVFVEWKDGKFMQMAILENPKGKIPFDNPVAVPESVIAEGFLSFPAGWKIEGGQFVKLMEPPKPGPDKIELLEGELSALKEENALLREENEQLKQRASIVQDDLLFVFETLANNGMI